MIIYNIGVNKMSAKEPKKPEEPKYAKLEESSDSDSISSDDLYVTDDSTLSDELSAEQVKRVTPTTILSETVPEPEPISASVIEEMGFTQIELPGPQEIGPSKPKSVSDLYAKAEVIYNPVNQAQAEPQKDHSFLTKYKLTEIKSVKDRVAAIEQKPEPDPELDKGTDKRPKR